MRRRESGSRAVVLAVGATITVKQAITALARRIVVLLILESIRVLSVVDVCTADAMSMILVPTSYTDDTRWIFFTLEERPTILRK